MKKNLLLFGVIGLFILLWSTLAWAQCPEDKIDLGKCDTLHLVALDTICSSFPCNVEVLMLITHDANEIGRSGFEDSISSFVVPLTWTTTNPSAYCSLGEYWNSTTILYPDSNFEMSVFRHAVRGTDTLYHNRMAEMANDFSRRDWDTKLVEMNSDTTDTKIIGYHFVRPYFYLMLVPTGLPDQRWWEGHRILLATLTFRVEEEMTICIDTVFWPPASHLTFSRADAQTYIPRDNLPYCFSISRPR